MVFDQLKKSHFIVLAVLMLFTLKAFGESRCEVHLKEQPPQPVPLFKSVQLQEIESTLARFNANPSLLPISYNYQVEIGRGGEGIAYLNISRQKNGGIKTTVHKHFVENRYQGRDYLVSEKGFSNLRKFKKQGLLPDFEIAKTLTTSRKKNAIYVEYVHGDNILTLTHEKINHGQGFYHYQIRPNLGAKELEVLKRYEDALEKTYQLWKDNPQVYIEASEVKVLGKDVFIILIIKDKKTDGTVLDLNPANTIYDSVNDRLVIIDPY